MTLTSRIDTPLQSLDDRIVSLLGQGPKTSTTLRYHLGYAGLQVTPEDVGRALKRLSKAERVAPILCHGWEVWAIAGGSRKVKIAVRHV